MSELEQISVTETDNIITESTYRAKQRLKELRPQLDRLSREHMECVGEIGKLEAFLKALEAT